MNTPKPASDPPPRADDIFALAFSSHPEGLVLSRISDGKILEINGGWERILGYSREECIGNSSLALGLIDPADRDSAIDTLRKTGRLTGFETRVRTKSGELREVQLSGEPLEIRGDACLLSVIRDVTEKRKAQRESRIKDRLYRTLAAHVPNSIVLLYDPGLKVLAAEGGGMGLFGLSPEMVEGKGIREITPNGAFERLEKYYRSALSGIPINFEYEAAGRQWSVENVPIFDEKGQVWAGLTVCRDVTEFRTALASAVKSESRNRNLLASIPDAIFRFDPSGICVDFRPGLGSLSDLWAKETALGNTMGSIFSEASVAEPLEKSVSRALASGQVQACDFPMTHESRTLSMEARTAPMEDGHVLVLIRDVTGTRNLERLAVDIVSREQRRLGSELHDGICQELTGISLHCKSLEGKLIQKAPQLAKQMSEISGLVGDSIRHVRALIGGLYPPGLERGLAEALRELVSKLGKAYPIAFSFIGENQAVDPDISAHLYRIAQEATGNAARHSQAKSVRLHLGLQGDNLVLKVTDDGKGIPGEAEGSEGKGMDIMRYRARLIGARVDVRSGEAGGTSVACILPMALARNSGKDAANGGYPKPGA